MENNLKSICDIVVETGKLIIKNEKDLGIEAKPGTANFVTAYDSLVQKNADKQIKNIISRS